MSGSESPDVPDDRPDTSPAGHTTVVIVTRDRVDELEVTLTRLESLPERPEVVVVDNASADGTADRVVAHHPNVRVLRSDVNLGAAGRTLGVGIARTPYVAFSDDDSWWGPGSLTRAAQAMERHPSLALVAARILVGPQERIDPTCTAMADSPLPQVDGLPGRPVLGFVACGAVVRRSAYLEVGGFHPRLRLGAEERLLAMDLRARGHRLQYLPDVVAYHHPSPRRDSSERRMIVTRNDLWSAWLRRPFPVAARATWRTARAAASSPDVRAGLAMAVREGGWVVRERAVLAADVEAELRLLEA